jgi:hypothetical protein
MGYQNAWNGGRRRPSIVQARQGALAPRPLAPSGRGARRAKLVHRIDCALRPHPAR